MFSFFHVKALKKKLKGKSIWVTGKGQTSTSFVSGQALSNSPFSASLDADFWPTAHQLLPMLLTETFFLFLPLIPFLKVISQTAHATQWPHPPGPTIMTTKMAQKCLKHFCLVLKMDGSAGSVSCLPQRQPLQLCGRTQLSYVLKMGPKQAAKLGIYYKYVVYPTQRQITQSGCWKEVMSF